MIHHRLRIISLALLLSLNASVGAASQLYSSRSHLYLIDQSSGGPTRVTDTPIGAITDLASNGQTSNPFVWAVSSFSPLLVKLRPATGDVISVVDLDMSVSALAIDPGDSAFYGVSGTELVGINPVSGEVTSIAVFSPSVAVVSLAFDTNGNLFGVGGNSFFSVDTSDATLNIISNSVPMNFSTGLAVRPEDGAVFLAANDSGYKLFTIDKSNGERTFIGDTLVRPNGLAFATIPEPSSLSALGLLLAFWFARRGST